MKTFWKALGIAALAAAVPVRWKKDEETGKKTFQSLLWKLDIGPAVDGSGTEIGLDLMEGVVTGPILNAVAAKKESALFADDEPEAALIEMDEAALDAAIAAEFGAEEVDEAALDAAIAEEFGAEEVDEAALDAAIAEEFGAEEVDEAALDAAIAEEFGAEEVDEAAPDAAETIETEA